MSRRHGLISLGAATLAVATPTLTSPAQAQPSDPKWEGVNALARHIVDARLSPGVSISVRKKGVEVYRSGFGAANLEAATSMTPETSLRIGSTTKTFTAVALLHLAEQGRLDIDNPLAAVLPTFPHAETFSLRQMLNHTAGLGSVPKATSLNDFVQASRRDYTINEMVDVLAAVPDLQIAPPGERYAYSNAAFLLLGAVIEKASGKAYADVIRTAICEPLGLTQTAVDDLSEVLPGRAAGYSRAEDPIRFCNSPFMSLSWAGAAGAMRSTPSDLCRFHEGLLGGKLLTAASLDTLLTPARLKDGTLPKSGATSTRYGLGVSLELDGEPCISHGGRIPGFVSDLRTYRDQDLTIAVLCNCDGGDGSLKALMSATGGLITALRRTA